MAIYPLGSNRPKRPFEFGLPEPDLYEGSYDDLFEPQNDIQNIRVASVMDQPPDPLYAPETIASERFKQLLDQFPERGNPTFMDKLAGAGAYLGNVRRHIAGGQDAAEKAKYAGYNRELEDWKEQIKPAEVASTQENQRNINSRNLAALEIKERNDTRRLDETERKNRETAENAKIRAQAYAAKANGFEIKVEGDRVMATHPVTLQRVDLGPSGGMDEIDKINLTGKQAQERADTMAAAQATRANIAAETSRQNTITAGAQTQVDAETQKPVVINPREANPKQVPVEGGTAIKKIPTGNRQPGEVAPARGDDLARVRVMTAEAVRRIKNDFLVMPDPKNKDAKPTLNPRIAVRTGYGTWNPEQYLPESPQRRAANAQKNLKDLLTLSLIGDMKEQSKTGATGFGQLTGRELDVLESAASRLDWKQDDVTLTQELIEILEKLERIMKPGPDEQGTAITPKRKETPAEAIKRLGGG